ncbi:MAG: helix-turn-helix domain-containing protein [Phycisphaera sp.]|nr:MAG: helix-turn-helix domain-containing protein [Phycisphaera sp.]
MTSLDDLLPLLVQLSRSRTRRRSLSELAAQIQKSPSHFQRAFSRVVGESPKQYGRRLQLECAAVLLISGNRSILQVAIQSGFESHEGFTRAFIKQYGISPIQFRKHNRRLAGSATHVHIIRQAGPCLQLFKKLSLNDLDTRRMNMNYDIEFRSISETTFLYKSTRCGQSDIAQALGEIIPAVFQHALKHGIEMLSPPTTLYTNWSPGLVSLKSGLCVPAGTAPTGDIYVETLPATDAAITIHVGPYETLTNAYGALEKHIAENGRECNGAPREVYLTDPAEIPEPEQWQTQVIWPITSNTLNVPPPTRITLCEVFNV